MRDSLVYHLHSGRRSCHSRGHHGRFAHILQIGYAGQLVLLVCGRFMQHLDEQRSKLGINAPQRALAREIAHGEQILVYFAEAVVVGQVVAYGVLPGARGHRLVVGKVLRDPRVDFFHGQAFSLGRLDRQKSETRKGIGRPLRTTTTTTTGGRRSRRLFNAIRGHPRLDERLDVKAARFWLG